LGAIADLNKPFGVEGHVVEVMAVLACKVVSNAYGVISGYV
jgi:hypothetical protein